MPELPDISAYIDALDSRLSGQRLNAIEVKNPFFLRTAMPPLDAVVGQTVRDFRRLGKRIAIGFDENYWLVIHLMIAGRFQWQDAGKTARKPNRNTLAVLSFDTGTLTVTEAGTKKRASLHVVEGADELERHNPGGLEVLENDFAAFDAALRQQNRTLKRALTDPRILSGIGNAYSDEILHAARLSPVTLTSKLDDAAMHRLFDATCSTLSEWRDRLGAEAAKAFPAKVTAFRPEMAVHGKYGEPCPDCGTTVQRIRYASNETNYCPRCQTDGKLLADRALSRLLKKDWPKSIEELEKLKPGDR